MAILRGELLTEAKDAILRGMGSRLIEISRHPDLNDCYRTVSATRAEYRREIVIPGSRERVFLTHWVPLPVSHRSGGVVAVFHDISDLKRVEKIRKDFVANVSHELKTPVTVIYEALFAYCTHVCSRSAF